MRRSKEVGFTIIETVLFLAVTGLMISGIMVGVGNSINSQRFRDSVVSLQSFLQDQYSNVSYTINNRNSDYNCGPSGVYLLPGDPSNSSRGQSDCSIIGKLIRSKDNKSLIVNSIVGKIPDSLPADVDDVSVFNASVYSTFISDFDQETYELNWGATYSDDHNNDLKFSVLILRSPISGVIRTFIYKDLVTDTDSIQDHLINNSDSIINELKICVINPDFTSLTSARRNAVVISANASGTSGVKTLGDNSECFGT